MSSSPGFNDNIEIRLWLMRTFYLVLHTFKDLVVTGVDSDFVAAASAASRSACLK